MFQQKDSDLIRHDDIIEDGIFRDHVIPEAEEFIKVIAVAEKEIKAKAKSMSEALKGIGFSGLNVAGLNKINEQIDEANKLMILNGKLKSAEVKNNAQLEKQKQNEAKTNAVLQKQKQEEVKTGVVLEKQKQEELKTAKLQDQANQRELKAKEKNKKLTTEQAAAQQLENQRKKEEIILAKAALVELDKTAGTLRRLEAANTRLRIERSRLRETDADFKKRLGEINAEIDKNNKKIIEQSDHLKQNRLQVGGYKDAIKEAAAELGLFNGDIGQAIYFAKIWGQQVRANVVAIKEQITAQNAATAATSKWNRALKVTGLSIKAIGIGAIIALLGSIAASFKTTESGIVKFEAALNSLGDIIKIFIGRLGQFGSGLIDFFPALFKDISAGMHNLTQEIKGFFGLDQEEKRSTSNTSAAIDKMSNAFTGMGAAIQKTIDLETELAKLRRQNRRDNLKDQAIIRQYASEVERLNQIADDQTLSFDKREKAADEALKALKKSADAEIRIKQRAVTENQKVLEVRKLQNEDTLDAQEALAHAQDELDDAQTKREILTLQGQQRQRTIRIKQLQNQVDLLEKTFDKEKDIMDQEIQDREKTFAQRQALIDKEAQLSEEKYKKEVEAVSKAANIIIDANELMTLSTEEELAARIKSFQLGDKAEDILLKAIINRRAEIKATIQQNKELDKDIKSDLREQDAVENERRKERIRSIHIALEEEIKAAGENIARQRELLQQKKMLRERELNEQAEVDKKKVKDDPVKSAELKAKEILLIEEKLQNDLKELQNTTNAEQIALWKKQKDEIVKVVNQITDGVADGLAKRSELQQQADQRDIDFHKRMLDVQARLAAEGRDNILAEELAAIDRAEERKIQNAKRAQRQQESIALFKVFTETLSAALDKKEPFFKAFAEALGATGVAKTVFASIFSGSAEEGTEDTGKPSDGKGIDGRGGMAYIVHPKERILTKEQNESLGGMTNEQLVANALAFENLYVPQFNATNVTATPEPVFKHDRQLAAVVQAEIRALRHTIDTKPVTSTNLRRLGEWTEEVQAKGLTTLLHHKKARSSMRKHA